MKLQEIKKIPQQSDNNPFDFSILKNLKPYKNANVEGNKLLFTKKGSALFFIVEIDKEMIAFAKVTKIVKPIKALVVNRTFVIPVWRNRGIMTALYRTLRGNGNTIISDVNLSPESISIWKKLLTHFNIQVIDSETGKIKRKATDDDLTNPNSNTERLMFEQYHLFGKPIVESGIGITSETEIFIGSNSP